MLSTEQGIQFIGVTVQCFVTY